MIAVIALMGCGKKAPEQQANVPAANPPAQPPLKKAGQPPAKPKEDAKQPSMKPNGRPSGVICSSSSMKMGATWYLASSITSMVGLQASRVWCLIRVAASAINSLPSRSGLIRKSSSMQAVEPRETDSQPPCPRRHCNRHGAAELDGIGSIS